MSTADTTASLVTEQAAHQQAETAPAYGEETLRLFIDSVKEYAIFLLDPQGQVQSWNSGAERIKGYRAPEILGQHFSVFYPPDERARGTPAQHLRQAAAGGRLEDEGWRVRKDGTRFWANVVITPLYDADGRLRGFGKVTRDLTERRQAEGALQQANTSLGQQVAARTTELQRALEELQQFAYVASHDLKEPLRMVTNFVQLLAQHYKGRLDTEAEQYIDFAVEGAQRMGALIHDLLAYARLETRQEEWGPLERVLADTLRLLQPVVTESGATITHTPLPTVVADGRQIDQVLQNLLSNALKFRGPEPPRIQLRARRQGPDWVVAVQDNGIGFDPQYAERIFKMFQRLHTHRAYAGSGIGLAVCKKVIERHGGRIWAESTPGQGATFFFTLPAL